MDKPRSDAGFEYWLPPELIAQEPPARRVDSRLMVTRRGGGVSDVHRFADLPQHLQPGDLLVVNDSRVLPARLMTRRTDTGGRVEVLLLQPVQEPEGAWLAMARPARRLRSGVVLSVFRVDDAQVLVGEIDVVSCLAEGEIVLRLHGGGDVAAFAIRHGDVPLPPYIRRVPDVPDAERRRRQDRERYQTVYARLDAAGTASVAAPTAGLHFDRELLGELERRGVEVASLTLHVGAGTFRKPSDAQLASGRLHAERFCLPAATLARVAACRKRGARVVAVGTTSLRVLETVHRIKLPPSAPVGTRIVYGQDSGATVAVFEGLAVRANDGWMVEGLTRLFIQPPDPVCAADILLTNFHLPGSSLLRLVAAFTGDDAWRDAYGEAVRRRLRFFSYGDAMLILPVGEPS